MGKTNIEWVRNPDGSQGYTINPVKGLCPMACPYCYARRMYKRFKWNPEIRFENPPIKMPPKGSRIFIGSTMELFGDWIKSEWLEWLFGSICEHKKYTFIFLTKCPQNLIKWSPFPGNCWVGVTATDYWKYVDACNYLSQVKAVVKFLSLEPLLSWDENPQHFFKGSGINWVIIGQQTPVSAKTQPKIEWVRQIVEAAGKAEIRVFLKDNLDPLLRTTDGQIPTGLCDNYGHTLRQEMPK